MAGSKPKRAKKMAQASPSNSEFLTRKQLVDKKLQDVGWTIVKFFPNRSLSHFQHCAIEEYSASSRRKSSRSALRKCFPKPNGIRAA